jgi:hypothetical protein
MFNIPQSVLDKLNAIRQYEDDRRKQFASLDNVSLVASAKFWLQHCDRPKRCSANDMTYDGTFWHAIIPELLKRLEKIDP